MTVTTQEKITSPQYKSHRQAVTENVIRTFFQYLLLLVIGVIMLLPFIMAFLGTVKTDQEILAYPPKLIASQVVLDQYRGIWNAGFWSYMRNSLFYAAVTILLGLAMGIVAAYGFDRFRFRGQKVMFFMVVASIPMSIGSSSILIPTYMYLAKLGMVDKWYTLPILYTLYNLPMAIWILKGSFEMVPRSLDDAARIDGCNTFGVLWRVGIPLIRPGIVSAAMFLFIGAWNDYLSGSVMVTSTKLRNIQFSIYSYLGFFGREGGELTAAAAMALVPIILLFVVLGRHLISGLTNGSVK